MTDTLPPAVARLLDLPSRAIIDATGTTYSSISRWRSTNGKRRPQHAILAGLLTLAPPEDHAAIEAWCLPPSPEPVAPPEPREETRTISARIPVSELAAAESAAPDVTLTERLRQGLSLVARSADLNAAEIPPEPLTVERIRQVATLDPMGPRDADPDWAWSRYATLLDSHRFTARGLSPDRVRDWMRRKPHIRLLLGGVTS